jgi:hypothetical protein
MREVDVRRENMEQARRAHASLDEFSLSINDSSIKSADVMLRNCLLINGGAAVAILAFMGTVISKNAGSHIGDIAGGLTYFAWGLSHRLSHSACLTLSTSSRIYTRPLRRRSGSIPTSCRESAPLGGAA